MTRKKAVFLWAKRCAATSCLIFGQHPASSVVTSCLGMWHCLTKIFLCLLHQPSPLCLCPWRFSKVSCALVPLERRETKQYNGEQKEDGFEASGDASVASAIK